MQVLFAHWIEAGADGRSTLVSEARVAPMDASARLRMRALWSVIGRFERLVGAEPLTVAARRARSNCGWVGVGFERRSGHECQLDPRMGG